MEDGDRFEQLSAAMTRHAGDEGSARLRGSVSRLRRGQSTSCSGMTTTAAAAAAALFSWNEIYVYPI